MATKTPSLDTIWRTPDALWNLIAPILGPEKQPGTVGRPPTPYRVIFDAIIFVLRSGCQWQVIPREAYAPGSTVHGRFRQWVLVWQQTKTKENTRESLAFLCLRRHAARRH